MLIFQKKYKEQSRIHQAVIDDDVAMFEKELKKQGSLSSKNALELTPKDLAVYLGSKKCLRCLEDETDLKVPIYRNKEKAFFTLSREEVKKQLQIDYTNHLIFDNVDILSWVRKKCEKRLQDDDYRQMNRWTQALHEKAIYGPPKDFAAIRWINPVLGYGVFATKDIKSLSYIGEYTGIIRKRCSKKDRFNNYVFRYVSGPKSTPFVIDAKTCGNFTRFINHSDEPNLTSRWIISRGITHIIVFANQFIPKGKQLTYNYGSHYWRSRTSPVLLT